MAMSDLRTAQSLSVKSKMVVQLASVLRSCTTDGAPTALITQHGIAGAGSTELTSRFDKDFDGDSSYAYRQQANGQ